MRRLTILLLALVTVTALFVACDTTVEESVPGGQNADIDAGVNNNTENDYDFVGTWVSAYDIDMHELTGDIVLQSGSLFPEEESTEGSGSTEEPSEPEEAPSEETTTEPAPTEPKIDISEFTDKIDGYMNGGKLTVDFTFMGTSNEISIPPSAPDISYTLNIDADSNYTLSVDKVRYDNMVTAYAGVMVENAKILAAAEGKTYEQILKAAKFASHDAFVASIKDVLTDGLTVSNDGKNYTSTGKWVFDGTYVTFDNQKFIFYAGNANEFELQCDEQYLYFEKA